MTEKIIFGEIIFLILKKCSHYMIYVPILGCDGWLCSSGTRRAPCGVIALFGHFVSMRSNLFWGKHYGY